MPRKRGLEIATAFFQASRAGDVARLTALLAEDVRFHADGGGKRSSASRILTGAEEVVRFLAAIALRLRDEPSILIRYGFVNGLPGFVTSEADSLPQTTALLVDDERIAAIYVMRNPDKLGRVDATAR